MRDNKSLPIIIILLCIILALIIAFGVSLFSKKGGESQKNNTSEEDLIAPTLDLSLDTTEEEQDEVTIYVVATTEDEDGIDYLVFPDNTKIYAGTKEYTVTENGTYTFKAVGVNGASSSLSIEVTNIREVSANNPYIPEGFEYVGGEVDSGYVIQDKYGNQYVWVPVPTGILTRSTMMSTDYSDSNSSATALVNSVAKNYGFYIARFEASAYEQGDTKVATSMAEKIPWTDVTFREAEEASTNSAKVFGYQDVATALMNSYAWDTTLEWINQTVTNYSTNTSYGNYSGTIYPTGSTESDQMNYICDLAGNVREWTTEEYSPITTTTTTKKSSSKNNSSTDTSTSRVIRGGSANLNKIANSRNGYPEDLTDGYWGFRMILYENK
jgi:uncharacterized protein YpmB